MSKRHNTHLDEFQDIRAQLSIKEVYVLQEVQEGKKDVTANIVELSLEHELT